MAKLTYEVWEQPDDSGQMLPGLVLAGPDGDAFRRLLEPSARLTTRFDAGSHFEAMTTYYQLVGTASTTTMSRGAASHILRKRRIARLRASGLTIRPSRRRFAARLNSGVR